VNYIIAILGLIFIGWIIPQMVDVDVSTKEEK